jgi:septum formation protein
MKPLILASTSPFRKELLTRLGLPFEALPPAYEEAPVPGLDAEDLARLHALGKAESLAEIHPGRIVIGSDQVAELDGEILGKPGTEEAAVAQLEKMSGRTVWFHTALAVVRGDRKKVVCEPFSVRLRQLRREDILYYVAKERPLHSAGSFMVEGLGIALMERLEGRDYTALIGLPLIALTEILAEFGVFVLSPRGETAGWGKLLH